MTPKATPNPYAAAWADARTTVTALINQVHDLGVKLDASRQNLHWTGGSEEYFQYEARRQHHYLHLNNDQLRNLLKAIMLAEHGKVATSGTTTIGPGGTTTTTTPPAPTSGSGTESI